MRRVKIPMNKLHTLKCISAHSIFTDVLKIRIKKRKVKYKFSRTFARLVILSPQAELKIDLKKIEYEA